MKSVSSIYMNGEVVGSSTVEREGLYFRIVCTCDLPQDKMYRIIAVTSTEEINLGVCLPDKEHAYLETKISVRRLGNAIPTFWAVPKNEKLYEYYEVTSEHPFKDITILRESRLSANDGKTVLFRAPRL